MPTPGIAANAYAQLSRITQPAGGLAKTVGDEAGGGGGPNFGALLKDAIGGVSAAGRKSDVQAQAMASGKANVVDVVTAVAEAETAVSALVAVRDNVIASYQEIMRMSI
jgi:flagellar hook-basal body complex protein FliE